MKFNDKSAPMATAMCITSCVVHVDERKSLKQLRSQVEYELRISLANSVSVIDRMMKLMDNYSADLERTVAERTQALEEAQKKTDNLLAQLLPPSIARQLKAGTPIAPHLYPLATVLYTDICNFTRMSAQSTPLQLVTLLNILFSQIDAIVSTNGAYKVLL